MAYGLYIHIPYCHSRCRYCDFYTSAAAGGVPDAYIDALLRDLARHAPRDAAGAALRPATVYLGGGTPSLLSPGQVARLLAAANPALGAEVTLEANPESATAEKLAGWRGAGVNRLSFGVQSARDESLLALGRLHTAAQARAALAAARAAGFENITGDIMLALPGYTRAEFDATLALLAEGGAAHVSAYLLKLEPGTPMGEAPPPGIPGADEAADLYLYAVERLAAAGYAQYEISNFAKPGFESRHNLLYWTGGQWLGLGPAAHSCFGGRRFSFAADTGAFLSDALPPQDEGPFTKDDAIMLGLRLTAGVEETAFDARQAALLQSLEKDGKARRAAGRWALTPEGMLVQNAILAALLK